MCSNDSFHGRLKSDIKTERNVHTHTHTMATILSLRRGITRMAACRHHHVCTAAVMLSMCVYVCVCAYVLIYDSVCVCPSAST